MYDLDPSKDTGFFQKDIDLCFSFVYNTIVRDWKQTPYFSYVKNRNRHICGDFFVVFSLENMKDDPCKNTGIISEQLSNI